MKVVNASAITVTVWMEDDWYGVRAVQMLMESNGDWDDLSRDTLGKLIPTLHLYEKVSVEWYSSCGKMTVEL